MSALLLPAGFDSWKTKGPDDQLCPRDCHFAPGCNAEETGVCELNECSGIPMDPDREHDEAMER